MKRKINKYSNKFNKIKIICLLFKANNDKIKRAKKHIL